MANQYPKLSKESVGGNQSTMMTNKPPYPKSYKHTNGLESETDMFQSFKGGMKNGH